MNNYYEITTSFLDPDNDSIQIYMKRCDDRIELSDDGYTLNFLRSHGFILSENAKERIQDIARQFGIQFKENELIVYSDENDFSEKKHMLIQAILRVSNLTYSHG